LEPTLDGGLATRTQTCSGGVDLMDDLEDHLSFPCVVSSSAPANNALIILEHQQRRPPGFIFIL
ncbi:MAG: hypothetical protein KUG77_03000, partial [Nannocystaceae bacterium]|nr:hypothetical protein [Nannocystaceae bacterium]